MNKFKQDVSVALPDQDRINAQEYGSYIKVYKNGEELKDVIEVYKEEYVSCPPWSSYRWNAKQLVMNTEKGQSIIEREVVDNKVVCNLITHIIKDVQVGINIERIQQYEAKALLIEYIDNAIYSTVMMSDAKLRGK